MHLGMAARGQRAFHPAGDYCHLCLLQGPMLPHRLGHMDVPCPALELGPGPLACRGLPFPFPLEDRIGNRDRHVPRRRQVYMGPSHCPVSESCGPPWYSWREVSASTWDWPLTPRMSPCTCEWERPRECECVAPWYPTEQLHPFNGGPVPQLLPAKVRGQGYFRQARYVSTEHYWDGYSGVHLQGPDWDNLGACGYNGHCERRHVTFESQNDRTECDSEESSRPASPASTHYNGPLAFFPTEVPQSQFRNCRMSGSRLRVSAAQGGEPKLGRAGRAVGDGRLENRRNQQKSQGTVRDQIKQVVTELEDVLGGLKQVQLEMKEVVQQIDILTSNIDLGEEELQDPERHGNCLGVVALVHDYEGDAECSERGGRWRTTSSLSQCGRVSAASSRKRLTNPCPPAHGPVDGESADRRLNQMPAIDTQYIQSMVNGDCLAARPPRAKVKELWHQRSGTEHVALSKTPEPNFPLAGLAKTQRPLLYSQNGQVKMPFQESNHPPDILKISRDPVKKKQFPSTVV